MIRVQDNVWVKRDAVISVYVRDGKVILYGTDEFEWVVEEKYLTDALTGLNVNVGDVLAQLGRSEHEAGS